jgi:hypothetical protein
MKATMSSDVTKLTAGSRELNSTESRGGTAPTVFVTHSNSLSRSSGGLQICTREYLETIRAAGFAPFVQEFEHDKRLSTRITQRIGSPVYKRQWHPALVDDIVAVARKNAAQYIFLNLVNLAPLVQPLRALLGAGTKIVLLSHGLESVDYLHAAGAERTSKMRRANAATRLGKQLFAEYDHRREIDHIFCLSKFEAEIERWLGAKRVTWLPRTVPPRPALAWRPNQNRIGFVGTLDHPPNKDGLVLFLRALESMETQVKVRLVGGPVPEGRELSSRFRAVEYLGPLADEALESEASTWSCFVHPLFCLARGCSTKLAVALSWQIPIATTPPGCRGYIWHAGRLQLAQTPEELSRLAILLTNSDAGTTARHEIRAIVASSPGIDEVAVMFREALLANSNE